MEKITKKNSVKEDCFAYIDCKKQCKALDRLYCKHERCNFYKNRDKEYDEKIEAERRTKNLEKYK